MRPMAWLRVVPMVLLGVAGAGGTMARTLVPQGFRLRFDLQGWRPIRTAFALTVLIAMTTGMAPGPTSPALAAFPGTNGKIVFSGPGVGGEDPPDDIFVIDPDGGNQLNLTSSSSVDEGEPAWSPDGAIIAFAGDPGTEARGIWVMQADGTNQLRLTAEGSGPTWSPDGVFMAFWKASGPCTTADGYLIPCGDIYIMRADGSDERRLTVTGHVIEPRYAHGLEWSPSLAASKIVFVGHTPGNTYFDIFVINADGSGLTALTDDSSDERSPAWSPDGSRMLFEGNFPGLAVMNADGSDKRALGFFIGQEPVWSPDGQRLAYTSLANIYVIGIDGTNRMQVTSRPQNSSGVLGGPDWQRVTVDCIDVVVDCTSTGQVCEPAFSTSFSLDAPTPVTLRYTVGQRHCSSVKLHASLDGTPISTTDWLGWPGATGDFASLPLSARLELGTVAEGEHTITLQAEGQQSGCNDVRLGMWGGCLSGLPATPPTTTTTTSSATTSTSTTTPGATTTSTTTPPLPCTTPADCDDSDPCTDDQCNVDLCSNPVLPGTDGTQCLLGRIDTSTLCGSDPIHRKLDGTITKKVPKAVKFLGTAETATSDPKRVKALKKVRAALQAILTKAAKFATKGKITGPCGQAIADEIGSILQRVPTT